MNKSVIKLHLIRTSDIPALPSLDAVNNLPVQHWFSQASGGSLVLKPVNSSPVNGSGICDAARLHNILRKTIPPPTKRPVRDIAIIFCRKWAGHYPLLGLMFDYSGLDHVLREYFVDDGVPREACAVFLDEFGEEHDDYEKVFTAIHELGHVFNLTHDRANSSFMANNGDMSRLGFNGPDCERLSAAARGNLIYAPGGENFRGENAATPRRGRSSLPSSKFLLKAQIGKDHYMVGETIVLELNLSPINDIKAWVPPELDPGYPALQVWIQNPLGERYLHRPHLFYCLRKRGNVLISRRSPIENNPRITFGSRGSNFNLPGVYKIWSQFQIARGPVSGYVRSNAVELEIVTPRNEADEEISQTLCRHSVGLFVANKGGVLPDQERQNLARLIKRHPRHPAMQVVRYALGQECLCAGKYRRAKELFSGLRISDSSIKDGLRRARNAARKPL